MGLMYWVVCYVILSYFSIITSQSLFLNITIYILSEEDTNLSVSKNDTGQSTALYKS